MAKAIIHNSDYQYIEEFGLILQKNFDSFSGEHEVLPYTCAFTGGEENLAADSGSPNRLIFFQFMVKYDPRSVLHKEEIVLLVYLHTPCEKKCFEINGAGPSKWKDSSPFIIPVPIFREGIHERIYSRATG